MRSRILCAALALIVALPPLPARAQNGGYTQRVITLWDASSATETFCALAPGKGSQGPGPVAAATSNTVTGTNTFANVAAGDELLISQGSNSYVVGVEARASASSITAAYRDPSSLASTTLTLTAAQFQHRALACGTGANSGAFSTGYGPVTIQVTVFRMAATGILWRIQCRTSPSAGWNQVYPELTAPDTTPSYITVTSAAVGGYTVSVTSPFESCRVGFTVDTDAGIQAISVTSSGRQS